MDVDTPVDVKLRDRQNPTYENHRLLDLKSQGQIARMVLCKQAMEEDTDFSKKYMFGLTTVLKKELLFNVIHNVNRPMVYMMLGMPVDEGIKNDKKI